MKIVLLTSEFLPVFGGIGAYARELANAGARLGHEVTVVAPSYFNDNSEIDANLAYKVIRYTGGRHSAKELWNKTILMFRLRSVFQGADIVHAVDWPFYIPLAIIDNFLDSRILRYITFHGTEINYMQASARKMLLRASSFWSKWATFVTNSVYTRDLLFSHFPASRSIETRAIPLGVNKPNFQFDRKVAREKLGISEDDFIILTVGRLVRRKGHLIFANALLRLDPSHARRLQWIICGPDGEADYMHDFEKICAKLPIRVHRAGAVSDEHLALCYAAADLFCLTSEVSSAGQVEGFGLVYLEAAIHGVPALGTRVGGIPDAVIDGETGVLVSPNDLDAVINGLIKIMDDKNFLKQLGLNAKQHADKQTWESVFLQTYKN